MKIITISREFGSGGRELGKRLADALGFDYYDKEILKKISEETGFREDYIEKNLEAGLWQSAPLVYQRSFSMSLSRPSVSAELMGVQTKVIREIAKLGRDFVIIGRCADVLLEDYHPLKIFVYADQEAKLARCVERASADEHFTEAEMLKRMKKVDNDRAKTRRLISDHKWDAKENFHLMINTSGKDLKKLTPVVAEFAKLHFEEGV